jgi:hypothetical protein
MSLFNWKKHTDEPRKTKPQADDSDPAPLLGRVGDGHTLESGERIARELRELQERRRQRDVDADAHVSGDPEMPIPNPDADPHRR